MKPEAAALAGMAGAPHLPLAIVSEKTRMDDESGMRRSRRSTSASRGAAS